MSPGIGEDVVEEGNSVGPIRKCLTFPFIVLLR